MADINGDPMETLPLNDKSRDSTTTALSEAETEPETTEFEEPRKLSLKITVEPTHGKCGME